MGVQYVSRIIWMVPESIKRMTFNHFLSKQQNLNAIDVFLFQFFSFNNRFTNVWVQKVIQNGSFSIESHDVPFVSRVIQQWHHVFEEFVNLKTV